MLAIGLASLVMLVLLGVVLAAHISRPLTELARETNAIGKLELQPRSKEFSSRLVELEHLAAAVEEMKAGLRSFKKYVPAGLVRSLLESGVEARLGGERRTLTVLFTDIVGFTGLAEKLSPEETVDMLSDYLDAMTCEIQKTNGSVDKYIGDAIMAFWGAPSPSDDHARAACVAALQMQKKLAENRKMARERGKLPVHCRIGINTGELIVGNMGSEDRLNYTAIGDTVNVSSRLEGLNSFYQTSILISESTHRAAESSIVARPIERVSVKGRSEGTLVYELLAVKDEADESVRRLAELSRQAVDCYYRREFARAAELFAEIAALRPGDAVATLLGDASRQHAEVDPPADWDGVRRMNAK